MTAYTGVATSLSVKRLCLSRGEPSEHDGTGEVHAVDHEEHRAPVVGAAAQARTTAVRVVLDNNRPARAFAV